MIILQKYAKAKPFMNNHPEDHKNGQFKKFNTMPKQLLLV